MVAQVTNSAPVIVPEEGEFSGDYLDARDMAAVAAELIAEHDEFFHLRGKKIAYLWKAKGGSAGGKDTLGTASLPNKVLKHFKDLDYIIWFAADHLRDRMKFWTQEKVEALVYHELLHCDEDDNGKATIRKHDFEGFGMELHRYGHWNDDLQIMQQATLPGVA